MGHYYYYIIIIRWAIIIIIRWAPMGRSAEADSKMEIGAGGLSVC